MKMNGGRIVVESLRKENVDTLFCYPGGVLIPLFDELYLNGDGLHLVQPRHEQGGTHAADAYARTTGKPGVVLVTSGPGATNTVTGITNAYMDSTPMVIITGQVSSKLVGTDAFQEADITGISMPITKENMLVKNITDLTDTLKRAFHIATTGRPGPVLVDITTNVFREEIDFEYPDNLEIESYRPVSKGHPKQIAKALDLMSKAEKPLFLIGGGVQLSNSTELATQIIDKFKIPYVYTLMGHGVNSKNPDLNIGNLGMHGTMYGNWSIQNCDLLIALGTRFSDRILGDTVSFAPNAKKIHVDIDPAEIGKNVPIDIPIVGDLAHVLSKMIKTDKNMPDFSNWIKELKEKKSSNLLSYTQGKDIKPQFVMDAVKNIFPKDLIVVTDVGQHQMWCHQYFDYVKPRSFITSGGLGTMGFGVPASFGAKLGQPDKEVVLFAGDGGFQMTFQELITIKREQLAVKIIVLDNGYLGMVRQWQDLFFEKRYAETTLKGNPDFAALATVFGIKSKRVTSKDQVNDAIKELAESKEAMLLHVLTEKETNVFPMVPAGKSLDDTMEG